MKMLYLLLSIVLIYTPVSGIQSSNNSYYWYGGNKIPLKMYLDKK